MSSTFMLAVVSLAANVILVLVTAWYAYLTHRLARSSERATTAAEESAQAASIAAASSRESVELQQRMLRAQTSTVRVRFRLAPVFRRGRLIAFRMTAKGGNPFIHRAVLLHAKPGWGMSHRGHAIELAHHDPPRVLAHNTVMRLEVPADSRGSLLAGTVHAGVAVYYSFDEHTLVKGRASFLNPVGVPALFLTDLCD